MTAPHDLDRQLAAFLRDGPTELPDPSFDAVRDRMESTRQRVVLGPWRVPDMSKFVPYGLGAAAVVVAAGVGIQFLRPRRLPSEPAAVPSVQPSLRLRRRRPPRRRQPRWQKRRQLPFRPTGPCGRAPTSRTRCRRRMTRWP